METATSHSVTNWERRSIDYVPRSERRGKVWHQGPFWFTGNFVLLTMIVGFTGPSLGLSVGWSILAIALGAGFGTIFMAFHANQGPRLGLPQMIQSRAQFGSRGAVIPFAATVFVYIGFMVFDLIVGTQALQAIWPSPGTEPIWFVALAIISIVIAAIGHDLLHIVQRWLTIALVVVFGILTVATLTNFPAPTGEAAGGWNATVFLLQLSLAAGYNISYAVYVSDYSRYLPARASAPKLIFWTYLGAAGSAIWLMSLGSLIVSRVTADNEIVALVVIGDSVLPGFGTVAVLVAAIALTTIMGVNAYGAMLTGVSAIDAFRPVRPTLSLRVKGLVAAGVLAVGIALLIPAEYLTNFNDWIILMLYFLVPWTAVNLVDFYFVRHGRYSVVDIFSPRGIYGRWSWRGMTAYLVGVAAMVPFFSLSTFVGPVAAALDGADISFLVGLIVSGGIYFAVSRNIDHDAEERAIEASERELEGTSA